MSCFSNKKSCITHIIKTEVSFSKAICKLCLLHVSILLGQKTLCSQLYLLINILQHDYTFEQNLANNGLVQYPYFKAKETEVQIVNGLPVNWPAAAILELGAILQHPGLHSSPRPGEQWLVGSDIALQHWKVLDSNATALSSTEVCIRHCWHPFLHPLLPKCPL